MSNMNASMKYDASDVASSRYGWVDELAHRFEGKVRVSFDRHGVAFHLKRGKEKAVIGFGHTFEEACKDVADYAAGLKEHASAKALTDAVFA